MFKLSTGDGNDGLAVLGGKKDVHLLETIRCLELHLFFSHVVINGVKSDQNLIGAGEMRLCVRFDMLWELRKM